MNDASHESHSSATGANQHERTDLSIGPIGGFAIVLILVVGGVLFLLQQVFWRFENMAKQTERPRSLLASDQVVRGPVLQAQSQRDLIAFRRAEDRRLASYGWVDRSRKIGRIPIETAMSILAERGFPEPNDQPNPPTEASHDSRYSQGSTNATAPSGKQPLRNRHEVPQ